MLLPFQFVVLFQSSFFPLNILCILYVYHLFVCPHYFASIGFRPKVSWEVMKTDFANQKLLQQNGNRSLITLKPSLPAQANRLNPFHRRYSFNLLLILMDSYAHSHIGMLLCHVMEYLFHYLIKVHRDYDC